MKKFLVFIIVLIVASLTGGIYGILHDQITYSISHEYYTKFKFIQFGLLDFVNENTFPTPRLLVSIVGFLATWWVGLMMGIVLGGVGLFHVDARTMWAVTIRALAIAIMVTVCAGIVGFFYGYVFLSDRPESDFANWYIPDNLVDLRNFILVGSIHNFSYAGAILGLVAGLGYTIAKAIGGRRN